MSEMMADFLPRDGHKLRFPKAKTLGEALRDAARNRFPRDTAKLVERAWGVDPSTAQNITKGHASERTLTKAVEAEGWDLLAEVGERMTGQSYEEHLKQKAEEARHVAERIEARRERVADLEARARRLDPLGRG